MTRTATWARALRRTCRATTQAVRRNQPLPLTVLAGSADRVGLAITAPCDDDLAERLSEGALVAAAFTPVRARLVLPDSARHIDRPALLCVEAQRVADGLLEAQWALPARATALGLRWGPAQRVDPRASFVSILTRTAAACVHARYGGDADAQRTTVLAAAGSGHHVRLSAATARRCGLEGVLPTL